MFKKEDESPPKENLPVGVETLQILDGAKALVE